MEACATKPLIKVAFASGTDDLNSQLIERMLQLYPELPLYVVSEFPPSQGKWVPYHVNRGFWENCARCRAAFRGKRIRLAGVLLVPNLPYRRMRLIALLLAPVGFLAYNEHLGSFMLRPRCVGTIVKHLLWRTRNFVRWQLNPGGHVYTFFWRLAHPRELRLRLLYWSAIVCGTCFRFSTNGSRRPHEVQPEHTIEDGISVVIPSRDGKELLQALLPGLLKELKSFRSEVIVVDNGSGDGTASWLHDRFAGVMVEHNPDPLSFARAVNRGIHRARYSHIGLLNNDMVLEADFFAPLRKAFDAVPSLFCATAQILFPANQRREETGKAVMRVTGSTDFPVFCELPIAGEDLSYVLYGSGGCSLYAAEKLRALGCVNEIYEPAYVEDLDLGYRAWQRGWPSVFVAGSRVEHRHRATTSRYFSSDELAAVLETNYLRFLRHAIASHEVFRELWRHAVRRLYILSTHGNKAAAEALSRACFNFSIVSSRTAPYPERSFLALTDGGVALFPGRAPRHRITILIASPYLPFPLSHGGAVRMYNLMRRAAADFDQVLVAFCDQLQTPPAELLEICAEIVLVRRTGSHSLPSTARPEIVEEFDTPAFHEALRQTVRKWRPHVAQLEFTQMAQYASDCAPAKTVLVEHDITVDLYEQLLQKNKDWDTQQQLVRWRSFEPDAWRGVDCVITMSRKDQRVVTGTRAECLPNGVDLERYRPAACDPDPARLLFIGSFAHLPNLLALEHFVSAVWPLLKCASPTLHVIAGARHDWFLRHYRDRVRVDLDQPGIELEGFVSDVRPAYERAAIVIAPLVASAGTNIKILEAMAMGKALVSTPAGINGLDLSADEDVMVTNTPEQMAGAILKLLASPGPRGRLERHARQTVERRYNWDAIAVKQKSLYRSLAQPML